MKKIDIAKRVTSFVVGIGTSAVVKGIIETNVVPTNIPTKVAVYVTSVVIGSMATKATVKHSDEMIDDVVKQWKELTASPETE